MHAIDKTAFWGHDANATPELGTELVFMLNTGARHAHHTGQDGRVYILTVVPAADVVDLKAEVAARAAAGNDPLAAHLATAGAYAAVRAWGAS